MSKDNLSYAQTQSGPLNDLDATETQSLQTPMNAKLTENDRRAVDFLLDGEDPSLLTIASPMARNAFMDRVQAVHRLLCLLDTMPVEVPSTDLLEATLSHMPMHAQPGAAASTGTQPAA